MHPTVSYPAVYTLPQSPYTFASETAHGCSFADSEDIRAKKEEQGGLDSSSSPSFSLASAPESHSNNLPDNKDAAPAPALSPLDALQARLAALNASNES